MRDRSLGVTALAFGSVMVGLYSQLGAVSLILTGSVFTPYGSLYATLALLNGVLFLGLAVAAYVVGYGLWSRKHWSWAGGVALFTALIGANFMLSVIASNPFSLLVPTTGAIVAGWYLFRPAIKAELLGTEAPAAATVSVPGIGMEIPKPAH